MSEAVAVPGLVGPGPQEASGSAEPPPGADDVVALEPSAGSGTGEAGSSRARKGGGGGGADGVGHRAASGAGKGGGGGDDDVGVLEHRTASSSGSCAERVSASAKHAWGPQDVQGLAAAAGAGGEREKIDR